MLRPLLVKFKQYVEIHGSYFLTLHQHVYSGEEYSAFEIKFHGKTRSVEALWRVGHRALMDTVIRSQDYLICRSQVLVFLGVFGHQIVIQSEQTQKPDRYLRLYSNENDNT